MSSPSVTGGSADAGGNTIRLLVIANRLPVSIALQTDKHTGKTEIKTTRSSGGLVSALQGLSSNPAIAGDKAASGFSMKWIGWPGTHLPEKLQPELTRQLQDQDCVPVFLDQHLTDLYYNGFCNNVLWPLFHYIPLPIEAIQNLDAQYEAYDQANRAFAEVILKEYQDGDLVWIHDYHLMLCPRLVKEAKPDAKIGFFFHTPFPSSEIYRTLPSRKELLRGVLASNLLGFHTHDYQRHFQSACNRILGANITSHIVRHDNYLAFLGTFPIGIDPDKFIESIAKTETQQQIVKFRDQFKDRKVLIGIDRLDYIKGIYNKLLGLERFLEQHPEWVGKVVLVQVAVPSRTDVPEYKRLRRTTHELVARINGRFGDISTQPIHYLDQSVPFDRMVALYRFSDAALITSVRDGMNLVAFEYIVAQKEQAGALILSEFAGAAQSLGAGCISFNPWSLQEVADAIYTGLTMPEDELKEREAIMYNHVASHTARHWAQDFIDFMQQCVVEQATHHELQTAASIPPPISINTVVQGYRRSKSRLIVLGVGGTLTRWQPLMRPDLESKPLSQLRPKLCQAITALANNPDTIVLLVSSMGREQMISLIDFYGPGLWLSAENGFFLTHHSRARPRVNSDDAASQLLHSESNADTAWKQMYNNIDFSWKESVMRVMEHFAERTPGTYIKEQETFISWHYDKATDKVYGEQQASLVLSHLTGGPLNNTPTEVMHITPQPSTGVDAPQAVGSLGSCIIVRPLGVTKGAAVKTLMARLMKQIRNQQPLHAPESTDNTSHSDDESDGDDSDTIRPSAVGSAVNSNEGSPTGTQQQQKPAFAAANKRPKQVNTALDRNKFPFDFVLAAGSFVSKDEDVYTVISDYADEGQNSIRSAQSVRSPAMLSRPSPRHHPRNPSSHNLASMAQTPTPPTRGLASYASTDVDNGNGGGADTPVYRGASTPNHGQSTPTGYSQNDSGVLHGSDSHSGGIVDKIRSLNVDTKPEDQPGYQQAGYSSYSLPSPLLSSAATQSPAFPPLRSSRNRSSSTENMMDVTNRAAVGRFPPPSLRMSVLGNQQRNKPSIFTATIGNTVSKAQWKITDTSSVEQLITSLAQTVRQ